MCLLSGLLRMLTRIDFVVVVPSNMGSEVSCTAAIHLSFCYIHRKCGSWLTESVHGGRAFAPIYLLVECQHVHMLYRRELEPNVSRAFPSLHRSAWLRARMRHGSPQERRAMG